MKQRVENSGVSNSYETFVNRIHALREIYAKAGFFIRALSPNPGARESFLALPAAKQSQINAKLASDLDFYLQCMEKKERLNNVKNIVEILAYWQKLKIPDEVMEKIKPNSLVEIHDLDCIQRYRSANFFSYTSHTLEDLESRPYFELFKKSNEVEQSILNFVMRVLSGELRAPDFDTLGKHRLWEINSQKKIVTQLKTAVLSPIFREEDNALAGMMHVCSVLNQSELTLVHSSNAPLPAMIRKLPFTQPGADQ